MLLVCIFSIIILGIIIVKRPRTIIWMGRYIRNKLLLFIIYIYIYICIYIYIYMPAHTLTELPRHAWEQKAVSHPQ